MLNSGNQRFRRNSSRSRHYRRQRGAARLLVAERLEHRLLLTAVETVVTLRDTGQELGSSRSRDVAVGDLDMDGNLDAFVVNRDWQSNLVWLNDGQGNFRDSGQRLGGGHDFTVALGYLNGDTYLDAFIGDNGGSDTVWFNDGHGVFTDSGQRFPDAHTKTVKLGDLDGDGDLDVFAAASSDLGAETGNESGAPNKVWLNDGQGVFIDSGQELGSYRSYSVDLGDVDADGDLDAYVANFDFADYMEHSRLWLNDGAGGFDDSGQDLGSASSARVSLGDLDADGDLDAFLANGGYRDRAPDQVWFNDGKGTFVDSQQALGATNSRGLALGDLDGDDDLDAIVTTGSGDETKVWLNDGKGFFSDSGRGLARNFSTSGVAVGELDGNGDLDAFLGNNWCYPTLDCHNQVWLNAGTMFGHLFHDFDEDGLDDDDGVTLVGRKISAFLDANDNNVFDDGEATYSATTNSQGDFSFPDLLPAGKYVISQTQPLGWTQTFPTDPARTEPPHVVTKTDNSFLEFDFGSSNSAFNTVTYSSSDVPKPTEDGRGRSAGITTSTLNVPSSSEAIADLNVELDLTHPDLSELTVYLKSPDGTSVRLFSDLEGSAMTGTVLDDEADDTLGGGSAPFTGRFQPARDLDDFDGTEVQGTWTLQIRDDSKRNTGILNGWSLSILTQPLGNRVPLAVDDADSTSQGLPVTTQVLANDELGDEPTLITAVTNPSANGGLVEFDAGAGTATYTPDPTFVGTDTFSYTITDDDGETSTATVTIAVLAASTIAVTSMSPDVMSVDDTVSVTIVGTGFEGGATVNFVGSRSPQTSNVVAVDANTITATVSSHKKFGGVYTVIVTNPDGSFAELVDGFEVSTSPPASSVETFVIVSAAATDNWLVDDIATSVDFHASHAPAESYKEEWRRGLRDPVTLHGPLGQTLVSLSAVDATIGGIGSDELDDEHLLSTLLELAIEELFADVLNSGMQLIPESNPGIAMQH